MSKKIFKDELKDWTSVANGEGLGKKIKNDKNFNDHFIKPCSMISIIGPTGAGKSTAIVEFLARKNNSFYNVIIFSGSTADEALIHLLKRHMEGITVIDNPDELPELTDLNEEEKKHEKLIVFDDMINLPKKHLVKIQKWFNSARKYGYTCMVCAQNYTDLAIQIRRNTMIYFIFRLHDNNSITQILRTHDNNDDDKESIKRAYIQSTQSKGNFFKMDFTEHGDKRYTHNFTDIIHIPKKNMLAYK